MAKEPGQLVHIHPSLLHTHTLDQVVLLAQVGQLSTDPVTQESPTNRGQAGYQCDWLTQVLRPIDQSVSEPQVPWEECALPWQHEAEPRNKLWRWDVRRLPMTERNPCVSTADWCEDVSGDCRDFVSGVSLVQIWSSPETFCSGPTSVQQHFPQFGSVSCVFKRCHRSVALAHFRSFRTH